ncbi:3-dehydroquinate synthase [Flexibacter flexilis DSM 6793]|uniref:3-dehydroquinate synthase n=1 Tax=Flexibacter flexilis DSM 6793 TaxID=927664 RepID=A0A1I1N5X1_9BACT|nr:3-dehydroquinate synthase [Flexibacter flexilis]SFC90898.1 3-dehydroquinate synthase [Flexibacter flexilis DSM 6793]
MLHFYSAPDAALAEYLAQVPYSQLFVLLDKNTKKHCYPLVKPHLPKHTLLEIPAGELHKNLETCQQIWHKLGAVAADRHALLLNVGGGVIGDMGGFCAALYKRGIRFVQLPTTLLAQADAATGGKTGVDFEGFKNQIGVFAEPLSVWIFSDFLKTLPERELRSGFAEVIKHCLIADATRWDKLRRYDLHEQPFLELVQHSVAIKQQVVAQDPTEKGLRKILNFGHTIGHAVESHFLTKPAKEQLLHGEAIAVGMICESFISQQKGFISEKELAQIEEFIYVYFGKITLSEEDLTAIVPLVSQDKKNKQGKIMCSLLQKIGEANYDQAITTKDIKEALNFYREG